MPGIWTNLATWGFPANRAVIREGDELLTLLSFASLTVLVLVASGSVLTLTTPGPTDLCIRVYLVVKTPLLLLDSSGNWSIFTNFAYEKIF